MNEDLVRVALTDIARTARAPRAVRVLPRPIVDAGPVAVARFLEFFAARIANRRTRAAYGRAVGQFLAWCEARGLALAAVSPLHVAAYIRTHPGSAPTVKPHHDAQSSRLNTALRLQPRFPPGISRLVGGFAHRSFRPCEYPRGYPSGKKCASTHDAEGILADY